jgi:branched-chain amino acid transport system permease protein
LIGRSTYEFGRVDVRVIVMLAFGGIGSLLGPIVGAAAFTWLDEFLIDYREMRLMIYGFVIIILFLGFRRGVVPTLTGWFPRSRRRLTRRGPLLRSARPGDESPGRG